MDSKKFRSLIFLVLGVYSVSGQTDDLMILEYIDSQSGNGGAIKVYNPTIDSINLSPYEIESSNNGGSCVRSTNLSGTLGPGQALIGYFYDYDNSPNNCTPGDFTFNTCGWNGDDHVAIKKNGAYVDMINNPTVANKPRVGGSYNGLYHKHIVRKSSNCTRYTSTNGTAANSWPTDPVTNVTGWNVSTAYGNCINATTSFNPSSDTTSVKDTICAGDSVLIGGAYRDSAGIYYEKMAGLTVCDSIIETTLTVFPTLDSTVNFSVCQGDSITVNGRSYKNAGTYHDTLVSQSYGCDSIFTINVAIDSLPVTHDTVYICSGDSANIAGTWRSVPGTYADTVVRSGLCDSVVNTTLYRHPVSDTTLSRSICQGDSVQVNGNYYSQGGTYKDTATNQYGCDSILTINISLDLLSATADTVYICSGDSANIAGTWRSIPGTYADTIVRSGLCDSVVNTTLYRHPVSDTTLSRSICQGDSVQVNGNYYDQGGTYKDTTTTRFGCDSVITLYVNILPKSEIKDTLYTCPGAPVNIRGRQTSAPGLYSDTLTAVNGCDSILTTRLYNYPEYDTTIERPLCPGDTILVNGQWVSEAGTFYDSSQTVQGCDSIITTQVMENTERSRSVNHLLCPGEEVLVEGNMYSSDTSFTYRQPIPGSNCDSVIKVSINTVEMTAGFEWESVSEDSASIRFQNRSVNASGYQWNFGDGATSIAPSPLHIYQEPGEYEVKLVAIHPNNCTDTAFKRVEVPEDKVTKLYIPNSFTPNGDGRNEAFRIGYSREGIPFSIEIFNRWGQRIFASDDLDFRWKGTFNGEPCMEGIYTFRIRGAIEKNGIIHLIR